MRWFLLSWICDPEIVVCPRDNKKDQFLVIGCDGIWDGEMGLWNGGVKTTCSGLRCFPHVRFRVAKRARGVSKIECAVGSKLE